MQGQYQNAQPPELHHPQVSIYPTYYPAIYHDLLWWIVWENPAHRQLLRAKTVGKHFLELYFSEEFRHRTRGSLETPPWNDLRWRVMNFFEELTAPFRKEQRYAETVAYLARWPEFVRLHEQLVGLERLHAGPEPIPNLPTITGTPTRVCTVSYPLPFSAAVALTVCSTVRRLRVALPGLEEQEVYHLTLVPENEATRAALILMALLSSRSSSADHDPSPVAQYSCNIALLHTLTQGLSKQGEDPSWSPETTYQQARQQLDAAPDALRAQLRATAAQFIRRLDSSARDDILQLLSKAADCHQCWHLISLLLMEHDPKQTGGSAAETRSGFAPVDPAVRTFRILTEDGEPLDLKPGVTLYVNKSEESRRAFRILERASVGFRVVPQLDRAVPAAEWDAPEGVLFEGLPEIQKLATLHRRFDQGLLRDLKQHLPEVVKNYHGEPSEEYQKKQAYWRERARAVMAEIGLPVAKARAGSVPLSARSK